MNEANKSKENMFRITDRSFSKILETLRLNEYDILKLEPNSVILEVGSGTNQAFARAIKELRPDILCVSLDPTLAIKPEDYVTTVSDWKGTLPSAIYYDNFSENTPQEQVYSSRIRDVRIEEANKTGNTIAALTPDLPFRENSIDLIVDSWAAGYYLDKNSNKFVHYIEDISRVLKNEGNARLFPVFERQILNLI